MHIEPGLVDATKIGISYVTAVAAAGYTASLVHADAREKSSISLAARSVVATTAVLCLFELMPHYPVGVSEVHLILGSTLFLVLGAAPAAVGLAFGLLLQGVLFEHQDLPQYGMNVTTLLVPLFALAALAKRVVAEKTAYVDLRYSQALALSTAYQGGVVAWVAFWAFYGAGVGTQNVASVATFGAAYMSVVLIEPLVDLAILAAAKTLQGAIGTAWTSSRLYRAA